MNAATTPSIGKIQHPAFDTLSDKAMVAFYNLGNIEKLDTGRFLFRHGDAGAPDSFLILDGSAALLNNAEPPVTVLQVATNDYLPAGVYRKDERILYSLQSTGELRIFRFDEEALASLAPDIQLQISRNLSRLASNQCQNILTQQVSLSSGKQMLARQIMEEIDQKLSYYRGSKTIIDLLRKIPRLPSYATRLTQMLADENVSAREAFETAKLDPSLTASVLKTVNSAAYGLRHKVMDFQHAFMLLGFNQIQQIIINKGVQSTMPKTPEFQQLQLHCVMTSALSQEISLALKQGNPPVLATIGLLHDIGKSVLLLLKREHTRMSFLINLLNSDLIGSMLLQEWKIPDDICTCLQYQSIPYQAPPFVIPPAHRVNMAILYVSHLCFDYLMEKPLDSRQTRYFEDYMKVLGCRSETLEEFIRVVLLPSVRTRMKTLPKVIQNFLRKAEGLTADAKLTVD